MKIIQIIPTFEVGGAEIMVENLMYKLKEMGHTVVAVCISGERTDIAKRIEKNGIQIIYCNKKKGFRPLQIFRLFRLFRQEKPDVIHTHLHCTIYAFPAAVLAGVRGKVHTLHSVAEKECGAVHKNINRVFFKHFGVVPVALSKHIQNTIVNLYQISAEHVPVIYNGIDLTKCIVKEDVKLHNPIKMIHVGRFVNVKNHVNLLKAFMLIHDKYPNSELLLLGDGELKEEIYNNAAKWNLLPYVRFMGQVSEVYEYLHNADIFVLPSIFEGMPLTMIEAMGCGLPIAAAPVGGITDMVQDRVNALYCGTSPESICNAVCELIQSEELRRTLSQNALTEATRFTSEEMASRYLKLYQSLNMRTKTRRTNKWK